MNNIQKVYDSRSTTYDIDGNRTQNLDQIVTEKNLPHLYCPTILEVSCGPGKNKRFLSQIADTVEAVDFSEGMISPVFEK